VKYLSSIGRISYQSLHTDILLNGKYIENLLGVVILPQFFSIKAVERSTGSVQRYCLK